MITIVFGPPGSGKGTQAAIIGERFGLPHISTGEMLREEVAAGSDVGNEVAPVMRLGGLVSDDQMVRIIERRLSRSDAVSGSILDGFPRTVPQARALDEMLQRTGREIAVVLFFDVPIPELEKRIAHRAKVDHRADDTPEAFVQRMREYETKSAPVMDYYAHQGTHVEYIDGNAPIDAVTESILAIFGGHAPGSQGQVA